MIELMLGALVVSAIIMKTPTILADAYAMAKAANSGQWDTVNGQWERREQRRMRRAAAARALADRRRARAERRGDQPGVGAGDYFGELAQDFWQDRVDRHRDRIRQRGPATWTPKPTLAERARDKAKRLRDVRDGLADRWQQRTDDQGPNYYDSTNPPIPDPWRYSRPVGSEPSQPTRSDDEPETDTTPKPEPAATEQPGTEPDQTGTETADEQEQPMPTVTDRQTAQAHANDMMNNDDAREAAKDIQDQAQKAADLLAEYEAAKAKLKATVAATADGMTAAGHDMGAVQAACEAADAIDAGDVAAEHGQLEAVASGAEQIKARLDKYLDAENMIAANRTNAKTLQTA